MLFCISASNFTEPTVLMFLVKTPICENLSKCFLLCARTKEILFRTDFENGLNNKYFFKEDSDSLAFDKTIGIFLFDAK